MMMTRRVAQIVLAAGLGIGCGGTTPAVPSTSAPAESSPTATGSTVPATGAPRVVIGFYQDASCAPGTEVGQRSYDTGAACFSWVAQGSHAQENSATRFQCWRDRLCYTQHPDSLTCASSLATDKESRVGECVKEPAGRLYSRVLGGTESCPPPPPGFQCPVSAPGGAR